MLITQGLPREPAAFLVGRTTACRRGAGSKAALADDHDGQVKGSPIA
jgi:hypothetical protein